MEADSITAFRQRAQPFDYAILKAAAGVLFPPGANVSDVCITLGGNLAQDRAQIWEELRKIGYVPKEEDKGTLKDLSNAERINLVVTAANNAASGAERFLIGQTDVEEYPAWEFSKIYDREVPETDWPNRWRAAAEAAGDSGALGVLEATGRMVALKSSGIWQALGDGVGEYDDALGNPWPPFAVGSGFDVDGIPHKECVKELELLKPGEPVKPAIIPSPDEIAQRFTSKLSQYLMKLGQATALDSDEEEPDELENKSPNGWMLLSEAKAQLVALGSKVDLETGAKILNMLTEAVQKIPEGFPYQHAEAYRATAEVLEAIGDTAHAIEYYEYALQKNPKIGVKRRLDALKKKIASDSTE
jgi:tetratricopeptide (TPR) repeat protein